MASEELRQAIVQFQLAALEKLATRDGVPFDRVALRRAIESRGISEAYRSLYARRWALGQQPASLLRRIARRWLGRP